MNIIKWIKAILPPSEWVFAVIVLLGILAGVGISIFQISNASSYLSSDPKTCINCHVMTPQYTTWERSSHARVATCMDCHVPHDNIFRKYQFKMKDGMRHATIFTLRQEPQVIQIHDEGAAVVQENCIRCHSSILEETSIHDVAYNGAEHGAGRVCWDCHRTVPHGQVRSLSATPNTYVPESPNVLAEWLKKFNSSEEKQN